MENEVTENQKTEQTVQNKTNNRCAIGSFVCALVGILVAGLPLGITAIITGILGLTQISKSENQKGKWMAIVGIVVGSLDVLIILIALPAIVAMADGMIG